MMWASENKWQRAYRRYPAVWYFLFFALGIYLGWEFRFSVQPTATLVAVVALFVLMLFAHRFFSKLFPLIVMPLVVLFGLAHMYAALNFFPPAHIALVKTGTLTKFSGIVVQARYRPDGRDRYLLALRSGEREGRSQPLAGKIQLVRGKSGRRLQLGDLVELIGQPERLPLPANPGMFNYRRFMNLRGVFGGFYYTDQNLKIASRQKGDFWQQRMIWPAGEYLRRQIERYFRGDTRAVLKALLIGQRSELQKSVTEAFKRSGIIHVLAISGLHVGFLLLMFLLLFGLFRLPYPWQVGLALICLFLFVVVVDFKPPVVRAFLMA
ncbi:MAG TPA: ComEC family competence protein, partial [Caldithrix abyssi]|nr:ComEC family competence protein [Caldithrix abyssi]